MDAMWDDQGGGGLEAEFDRMAFEDDDSAAREILASGMPIARDDTPPRRIEVVNPAPRPVTASPADRP